MTFSRHWTRRLNISIWAYLSLSELSFGIGFVFISLSNQSSITLKISCSFLLNINVTIVKKSHKTEKSFLTVSSGSGIFLDVFSAYIITAGRFIEIIKTTATKRGWDLLLEIRSKIVWNGMESKPINVPHNAGNNLSGTYCVELSLVYLPMPTIPVMPSRGFIQ